MWAAPITTLYDNVDKHQYNTSTHHSQYWNTKNTFKIIHTHTLMPSAGNTTFACQHLMQMLRWQTFGHATFDRRLIVHRDIRQFAVAYLSVCMATLPRVCNCDSSYRRRWCLYLSNRGKQKVTEMSLHNNFWMRCRSFLVGLRQLERIDRNSWGRRLPLLLIDLWNMHVQVTKLELTIRLKLPIFYINQISFMQNNARRIVHIRSVTVDNFFMSDTMIYLWLDGQLLAVKWTECEMSHGQISGSDTSAVKCRGFPVSTLIKSCMKFWDIFPEHQHGFFSDNFKQWREHLDC